MTDWYVNSAATGTNAGTSWVNACTSLQQLLGLGSPPAAGDRIFMKNTSAETYATAQTFSFPGTVASPNQIYSVNTTTNQPPLPSDLLAGASVSTTGNSAMTIAGEIYCFGVNWTCGSGANAPGFSLQANGSEMVFQSCVLALGATNGQLFQAPPGGFAGSVTFNNTQFKVGNSGSVMLNGGGKFKWKNTAPALAGPTFPNPVIDIQNGFVELDGLDFTGLTAGQNVLGPSGNACTYWVNNCKVPAGVNLTNGTIGFIPSTSVNFNRTGTGALVNQYLSISGCGQDQSNSSIYRNGGSVDFTGANFSKSILTTAQASFAFPLQAVPIPILNKLTGSPRTVTLYGIWDSPYGANTPPNNNDLWIEVKYMGDSGDPLALFVNSAPTPFSPLTTGSAYSTDSSSWVGTGGFTNPSPFKIVSPSFTPQLQGPITVNIYIAKTSQQLYLDGTVTVN